MASIILNEIGYRAYVIERQLAQCKRNDVCGAYNRTEYLLERQSTIQQYVDVLDALVLRVRVIPLQRVVKATV